MSEELKTCPFCGGVEVRWMTEWEAAGSPAQWVADRTSGFVVCPGCQHRSSDSRSQRQAIAAWNRRSDLRTEASTLGKEEPGATSRNLPACSPSASESALLASLRASEEKLKAAWAVAEAAWPLVAGGWEGMTFEKHEALVEAFRPLVAEARDRERSIALGMINTEAEILTTASKGTHQIPISSVEKIGRNILAALKRYNDAALKDTEKR